MIVLTPAQLMQTWRMGAGGDTESPPYPGTPSGTSAEERPDQRWRYRAVFISDLHLGTPGCQAAALLDFIKGNTAQTVYLVGDIVDGWQLRRRWFWPQAHNDVLQKLLRLARKGTRVVFVPGNHDEFARQFDGHHFGGIEVLNEATHVTSRGKRLWVVHGDQFDGVVQCAPWLAHLGDHLYGLALRLNRHFNSARARMGLPYWSLSQYLKHKVKKAVNYVSDFEAAVAREARQRGFDGVVCGHIHRAEIRDVEGVLYVNDGDWVESLTAAVETHAGEMRLLHWAHLAHQESGDEAPEEATATTNASAPAVAREV